MEKQSIKLTLLGRQFPVIVDEEEAAALQQAVKIINEKIARYRVEYGRKDDVDVVLMCCLEIATEFVKQKQNQSSVEVDSLLEKLSKLESQLDISAYIEG